jgi:hypothetical protein
MAKKKLKELCNRLRVKWADLYHIAIYHRHSIYIRTVRPQSMDFVTTYESMNSGIIFS